MMFPVASWRPLLLPLVLMLLWWGTSGSASAAVSCTATMSDLVFGTVDLVDGAPVEASATLNYACENDTLLLTAYTRVCFNIGDGVQGPGFTPRLMKNGTNVLTFQLYRPGGTTAIWGSNGNPAVPMPFAADLTIPPAVLLVGNGRVTGSTTLRGVLTPAQSAVAPGPYVNNFSGGHTSITQTTNMSLLPVDMPPTCGTILPGRFPFVVSAAVSKSCVVNANPLNFGPVQGLPGQPNVDGATTLEIKCSPLTNYTVALTPRNGNANGAGVMTPVGGGTTPAVPYQLYQTATSATPWGNTLGVNRVAGTGTGALQSLPVYGRVPGANLNVTPGDYMDTVTVNVSY